MIITLKYKFQIMKKLILILTILLTSVSLYSQTVKFSIYGARLLRKDATKITMQDDSVKFFPVDITLEVYFSPVMDFFIFINNEIRMRDTLYARKISFQTMVVKGNLNVYEHYECWEKIQDYGDTSKIIYNGFFNLKLGKYSSFQEMNFLFHTPPNNEKPVTVHYKVDYY